MKNYLKRPLFTAALAALLLTSPALAQTRQVTDMAGYTVTLPPKVDKVVNLWYANTAGMIALGAGPKLSGAPAHVKALPWARFMYPEIVNVPTAVSNAEELLRVSPDLVVVSGDDALAQMLNSAGIPAIQLMFHDYDSMKRAYGVLGEALGEPYAARFKRWGELVDANLARVRKATGDIPENERPVVYYMQGRGFYSTFGARSIMNDWIAAGGGISATKKLNLQGNTVSAEDILRLNPDVIIIGGNSQRQIYDDLMRAEEWRDINAVKNGRVYTNPIGVFAWDRFSSESALQILFAASVIHPERFTVDLPQEIIDFYKEFAGVTMTRAQAQYMIDGLGPDGEKYAGVQSR